MFIYNFLCTTKPHRPPLDFSADSEVAGSWIVFGAWGEDRGDGVMLIKEYRVVMPLSITEYQVGQLYSVAQASLNETGGGEGVEVLKNERFENHALLPGGRFSRGQYTHKIYHLQSRIPAFVRMLLPAGSMDVHEESWNAFPYCRTVITNPGYMKQNFMVMIESMHLADRGQTDNAHELSPDKLRQRQVFIIDIANDHVSQDDYKPTEDPAIFKSTKTGRGPLTGEWRARVDPVMTCYKLVTCEFKWFGLQGRVESYIQVAERRLFTNFHRQVFCWIDQWHGMTMQDVRALEERVREDLNRERKGGHIRGTKTAPE